MSMENLQNPIKIETRTVLSILKVKHAALVKDHQVCWQYMRNREPPLVLRNYMYDSLQLSKQYLEHLLKLGEITDAFVAKVRMREDGLRMAHQAELEEQKKQHAGELAALKDGHAQQLAALTATNEKLRELLKATRAKSRGRSQ
jgi:hypothetical protein